MIPGMHICRAIAQTLKHDELFQKVARDNFGVEWKLLIGFDGKKTDWEKQAPCVVISPWKCEPENDQRNYSISLTIAIVDDSVVDQDGVRELRGLQILDDQAWQAAWPALQDALPGLEPLATLGEPSVALSQEHFPLLLCLAGLVVEVNLPIGERRL